MKYFIVNTLPFALEGQVVVKRRPGEIASRAYRLSTGERVGWPGIVTLEMAKDRGRTLAGLVANTMSMLIVRKEMADVFMHLENSDLLEVLPAEIRSPEGQVVSREYSVLNPLEPADCLDVKASQCKLSGNDVVGLDEDKVVLTEAKIPRRSLFRMSRYPSSYVVSSEALKTIKALSIGELNVYLHDVVVAVGGD